MLGGCLPLLLALAGLASPHALRVCLRALWWSAPHWVQVHAASRSGLSFSSFSFLDFLVTVCQGWFMRHGKGKMKGRLLPCAVCARLEFGMVRLGDGARAKEKAEEPKAAWRATLVQA